MSQSDVTWCVTALTDSMSEEKKNYWLNQTVFVQFIMGTQNTYLIYMFVFEYIQKTL